MTFVGYDASSSAADAGHTDIVQMLLEKGADPNADSLDSAAAGGHVDIMKLLLEKGADPSKLPPPDVVRLHGKMIEELEARGRTIFPFNAGKGRRSTLDIGYIHNMKELFIKMKKLKEIEYGEYTAIHDILMDKGVAGRQIIDHYTGLIKEAFKKGESAWDVGQQYDDMQASGSNV